MVEFVVDPAATDGDLSIDVTVSRHPSETDMSKLGVTITYYNASGNQVGVPENLSFAGQTIASYPSWSTITLTKTITETGG